jgi:NADPH-dependent 2,4-dienoyl-CoA reductase/sulfur reductase-like enzyme
LRRYGLKNIVLLTIDTLRKDVLGCYGDKGGLSPFIDSIQERCIRFTEAQRAVFDPLATLIHPRHIAAYYPGTKPLHMKTISDRASGRLLGSQVIGEEGVDKRIDVLATAIYHRMPLDELLQLDFAYAPPYSGARDPVVIGRGNRAELL